MSLASKIADRPYICGVFLCFNTVFTPSTTFQNFYDTDFLQADVLSLYSTQSKVSFTETKVSTRAGYQFKQTVSVSLPIGDELRSENVYKIHTAEQIVLKLTNGEYLLVGRNDKLLNLLPKVSYQGAEHVASFTFNCSSITPSGYTDIENIGGIPDDYLFVLLENGVTIKYLGNNPGDTGTAIGDPTFKTYTAVDQAMFEGLDPTDPNLDYTSICTTLVTDLSNAFLNTNFNQNIGHFDTSNVTSLLNLFRNNSTFNQNINSWDVSNVTDFRNVFLFSTSFNQPLNQWDVSSGIDMQGMISYATSFNQNINTWDVSNVINMAFMFNGSTNFNQPLNNWDVSNVENMRTMFNLCSNFNQPLNNWNTSSVTNMLDMFNRALNFDQDLSSWCVQQIPTQPIGFDNNASSWTLPRPNWGAPC